MTHRTRASFLAALLAPLGVLPASLARAENPKKACVEASTDGQTLRREDKLLEARDKLLVCADDPCPTVVKSHCTRWLGELEAQVPTAIVRVKDAAGGDVLDIQVTLDGKKAELGRPATLDPGEHVVSVARAGGPSVETKFLLVDGDKGHVVTVRLSLGAAASGGGAADESSATTHAGKVPVGAWVLGGVGLVALGSFTYFAVRASDDLSSLRQTCAPACTRAETSSGRTHALLADVSLGVGIAALGGAVGWALFGRSDTSGGAKTGLILDARPIAGGGVGTLGFRY